MSLTYCLVTLALVASSSACRITPCTKILRPVCGDDGVTYNNECMLNNAACAGKKDIGLLHEGPCGQEMLYKECSITPCTKILMPVCGDDGVTYNNECLLKNEACASKRDLKLLHSGPCSDSFEDCKIKPCNRMLLPVCGDDGVTYNNPCMLQNAACAAKKVIKTLHEGPCAEATSIEGCRITPCPRDFKPVCGDDGATYNNQCLLKNAACGAKKEINIVHRGPCFQEMSMLNIEGCQITPCNRMLSPVCGDDGVTYNNPCMLKNAACAAKKAIKAVHEGPCDQEIEACQITPCNRMMSPVCGDDGVTYNNPCLLKNAACAAKKVINAVHEGPCGQEMEACQITPCTRIFSPVCGDDGVTYNNECLLKNEACASKKPISLLHSGPCRM